MVSTRMIVEYNGMVSVDLISAAAVRLRLCFLHGQPLCLLAFLSFFLGKFTPNLFL
jgi:hypothetical protein